MFGNQIYKLKMTQNTSSNSSILEIMDSKEFHNKNKYMKYAKQLLELESGMFLQEE